MTKSDAVIYDDTIQDAKLEVIVSPLLPDVIPERLCGSIKIMGVTIDWAYRFDRITAGSAFRHKLYNSSIPTDAIVAELKEKVSTIASTILTDYKIDITAIEQAAINAEIDEELLEVE